MHSFSRSLLGLGALTLAGCGAPAELDESLFPAANEAGYPDGPTGSFTGGTGAGTGGAFGVTQPGGASGLGGAGGTSSAPPGGTGGNVAQGGSAPVPSGGSSSVSTGGSAPVGPGGEGGSSTGGTGEPVGGLCPDDITELFARPASEGGCDGAACHVPGVIGPDLVSPNVVERLLNVVSTCNGRPYIGADDSFLADKLVGDPPDCGGFAMPFGTPQSLSDADEQCILDWIDEVSGG